MRCQRGFTLIELTVVILILTLGVAWGATAWMRQAEDAAAQATGRWLLTVKTAVDQMLIRQADVIAGISAPRPGAYVYSNVMNPGLSELGAAGHLPTRFPAVPSLPYTVTVHILSPKGDCDNTGCRIEALTVARPVGQTASQAADVTRLAGILTGLEGYGLSVHPFFPRQLRGALAEFNNPPDARLPAMDVGTIAAFSVFDTTQHAQFVRHNDVRDTALRGELAVRKEISSQAGLRTPARVQAGGRVSAGEYLQVAGIASDGTACEADGLVGRSPDGQLLVCHGGRWQGAGSGFGGAFGWDDIMGCEFPPYRSIMINPRTGSCSCPPGFVPFEVSRTELHEFHPRHSFHSFVCIR
jgi:prepilin-type N-terminal cleavage/methylation domain-containing protein